MAGVHRDLSGTSDGVAAYLRQSWVAPPLRTARDAYRAAARAAGLPSASDAVLRTLRSGFGEQSPRVSVVVATIGRSTLQRTVDSAAWAWEVIAVFDCAETPSGAPAGVVVDSIGPTGHWGAEQRTFGMSLATGTYLAFIDDDDVYTARAGDVVQRAVAARPSRVHVFKMRDGEREYGGPGCVWQGGIGTPMFVVPNDGRLGEWTTRREGDFDFIRSTLATRGTRPRFHEEVIALVRPEGADGETGAATSRPKGRLPP